MYLLAPYMHLILKLKDFQKVDGNEAAAVTAGNIPNLYKYCELMVGKCGADTLPCG